MKIKEENIQLKRAYETPSKDDGVRILVDRLWPRGVSKEKLEANGGWVKNIAPSNDLRKWFNHDDSKFNEFKKKYEEELKNNSDQEDINKIKELASKEKITLLFGAKNIEHNNAVVLKDYLLNK